MLSVFRFDVCQMLLILNRTAASCITLYLLDHMLYFMRDEKRLGAAQYNIYHSEDGKCFVLDFWVFPQCRGNGTGRRCFEALRQYTATDGATYYEINCERENAHRFWTSLGFVDTGVDEDGMPLMQLRDPLL